MNEIFSLNRGIKKMVIFCICLMLTLLYSGCGSNQTKKVDTPSILPTKLTEKDNVLFQQMGIDRSLVFDVNLLDANISWGNIWIDQYEYGKFKQRLFNMGSSIITKVNEPTHIVLSIHEREPSSEAQKWVLSLGGGRASTNIDIPFNGIVSTSKVTNEVKIEKGKTLTLGVIAQGKHTAYIPEDFFVNEETRMKELLTNEVVYVLCCRFK